VRVELGKPKRVRKERLPDHSKPSPCTTSVGMTVLGCLLMALNGHQNMSAPMSAFRGKADAAGCLGNLDGVLGCLNGASSDDLSRWFRFEHGWLFRKRIDPLTFFRRGLFDDDELGEAGQQEGPAFLHLLVAHADKRFEDALDVLLAQPFVFGSDFSIN
jgi:hypothetical protein